MQHSPTGGPVPVAHESEIPDPGSFVTVDVHGSPLLIVRQDDGSVAALSNVCRHRGAQVETRAAGRRKMFSCPYHRWCYNRDGGIRSMPFDDGFTGVDRVDRSLLPFPVAVRHGFVWTVADRAQDLDLDGLDSAGLDHLDTATLLHARRNQDPAPGAPHTDLQVSDRGTHVEVRSVRPAGHRGDGTVETTWILLAADAGEAEREAAEARWESLGA